MYHWNKSGKKSLENREETELRGEKNAIKEGKRGGIAKSEPSR